VTAGVDLGADTRGPAYVNGIEAELQSLVANLVDNAVKYSPDGGTIRVSVEMTDSDVALRVSDHGIGLPAGASQRVFEPFNRAANVFAGNIPGLGLGLHICRQIVQRHGGRIWADSPGEGLGTTVHVTLPYAPPVKRGRRANKP